MNDDAAAAHFEKARSKLRAARVLLEANEAEDCGERRSPRFSPHFPHRIAFPRVLVRFGANSGLAPSPHSKARRRRQRASAGCFWCPREDSNLHGQRWPLAPEASASTSSATWAVHFGGEDASRLEKQFRLCFRSRTASLPVVSLSCAIRSNVKSCLPPPARKVKKLSRENSSQTPPPAPGERNGESGQRVPREYRRTGEAFFSEVVGKLPLTESDGRD